MRQCVGSLVLVLATFVVAGCSESGPKRARLSGAVTYDGKPIPYGEVLFTPDAARKNSGPQGIAPIRDGHYDTGSEGKGVSGGPTIVRVTGFTGPGGKLICEVEFPVDIPTEGGTHNLEVPRQKDTPPPAKNATPDI